MTAQIGDHYFWNKKEYTVVALSAPMNFKPQNYGLEPQSCCTACWRGYWCEYNITDTGLFLQNFYMYNREGNYPDLNGVSVSPVSYHEGIRLDLKRKTETTVQVEDYMGHRKYEDVMMRIPYTGRILVGRKFLSQYYIHMGFQRSWAYEELREFIFENGYLIEAFDHSDMAQNIRKEIERKKLNSARPEDNIALFVKESFSLDYNTKAWWIKDRKFPG